VSCLKADGAAKQGLFGSTAGIEVDFSPSFIPEDKTKSLNLWNFSLSFVFKVCIFGFPLFWSASSKSFWAISGLL